MEALYLQAHFQFSISVKCFQAVRANQPGTELLSVSVRENYCSKNEVP